MLGLLSREQCAFPEKERERYTSAHVRRVVTAFLCVRGKGLVWVMVAGFSDGGLSVCK
jgi:hypothetical protein